MLHAKFFTVDDVAGVIDSSNMDYRSFGLDYEISLMGTHPRFVADLQRIADEYRAASRELTAEVDPAIYCQAIRRQRHAAVVRTAVTLRKRPRHRPDFELAMFVE